LPDKAPDRSKITHQIKPISPDIDTVEVGGTELAQ
jgi:hypothetical protein